MVRQAADAPADPTAIIVARILSGPVAILHNVRLTAATFGSLVLYGSPTRINSLQPYDRATCCRRENN